MIVNIIGCGPTGMTIAWELSKLDDMEIHMYDKKPGPGGSWWEPDDTRDLHAPRALFKNSYVNFQSLLGEMGIQWSELFGVLPGNTPEFSLFTKLGPLDYWKLTLLSMKVLALPHRYLRMSLKDALGEVTPYGGKLLSSLPYIMDGVSWEKMTAYEFVVSADWVGLSDIEGQKVSGSVMSRKMENALKARGIHFHYDKEVLSVAYGKRSHRVMFTDSDETLTGNLLILAVDHGPAKWLVGDNWGADAFYKLKTTQYQCVTLLIEYEEPIEVKSEFNYVIETPWNMIVTKLSDEKTLSVVMCDTDAIGNTPPGELVEEMYKQTGLPRGPVRFCWGSEWDGARWIHHQTSGVLGPEQIPFWGECPTVALCGMMSPRDTPFASIEAAVEVGRRFTSETFGVGKYSRH